MVLAYFSLIRFVNCLIAAFGVLVGARLANAIELTPAIVLAAVAAFATTGLGNALNDLLDLEADRINRPERVLVNGRLTKGQAVATAISLGVVAIVLGFAARLVVGYLVLLAIGILAMYSLSLKRLPLIGNIGVAFLGAAPILAGALAAGHLGYRTFTRMLSACAIAFWIHLIREVVKTVEDKGGDRAQGAATVAVVWGARRSLTIAMITFVPLVIVVLEVIRANLFPMWFGVAALTGIVFPVFALVFLARQAPSPKNLGFVSSSLKFGMFAGLILMWLAS